MKESSFFSNLVFLSTTLFFMSCQKEEASPKSSSVWEGAEIQFEINSNADPTLEINQDRITDNVWITRGSNGQIFNYKANSEVDEDHSPVGTEWALGSLKDYSSLTYTTFRKIANGKPKSVVDNTYIVHLIEDDIYLQIHFISWESGGGVSYTRTTK